MLDGISQNYPDRVARVEWHVATGYPFYNAEAKNKWFLYPPEGPYYYYGTLYADGKNQYRNYSSWAAYVAGRLLVPTDVSLTHGGTTYDPGTRNGQVQVECYNAGSSTIDAALQFAITEDSLYYTGPNGDPLHNGVCRDYVPNQYGTAVTLAAGARDTITVPYTLQSGWVEENVKLVLYLQKTTREGDTLATYQGLVGNVLSFTGVEESKLLAARDLRVSVSPNPCRTGCEFTLSGAAAHGARISVYTPDGRLVSSLQAAANRASWSRAGVSRGIYLYRVNAGTATAEGKLVVVD